MFYLSLSFLPRDKICFYCIHARKGVVLKKNFIAGGSTLRSNPFPFYIR